MISIPINTVHSTTNYDMFTALPFNRGRGKLNEIHLNRLEKSIKEENLLSARPIIVTSCNTVIDGHHRLEVAKRNKLPIYYLICPEATYRSALRLTNATTDWTVIGYIENMAANGQIEYKKLHDFLLKNSIPVHCLFRLLTNNQRGHKIIPKIKDGSYKFPQKAFSLEPIINNINILIKLLEEVKIPKSKLNRGDFWYGCYIVMAHPNFRWSLFEKRILNGNLNKMVHFNSWRAVADDVLRVFNHDPKGSHVPVPRDEIFVID